MRWMKRTLRSRNKLLPQHRIKPFNGGSGQAILLIFNGYRSKNRCFQALYHPFRPQNGHHKVVSELIAFPDFVDFSSPDQTTQHGFHPLKPEADQQLQGSWSPGTSHLPCSLTRRQLAIASFIGLTESALPPMNTCLSET